MRHGKCLMDTSAAMRLISLPNEVKCAINTNCFKKIDKHTPHQLLKTDIVQYLY